ncbi:Glycine receptor subunit beta-type 4-like protein [Leptotrombidium deliense]|uniref:Glycine receptor subunit beta-type 4-like protein n=1 Tax=Leptotrombidium deliense TaxID=299467 RepID=A0A443SWD8_9ACAR|nr:Glycine receptor subunit beta-type 4-like protein [Leptotrombidium deliense]
MSAVEITLKFERSIANSLAGVYTPTFLIVITTFLTFWFGSGSSSERVTVGMTALLAVVTTFAQTRKELPPISYISWQKIKFGVLNVVIYALQKMMFPWDHWYFRYRIPSTKE